MLTAIFLIVCGMALAQLFSEPTKIEVRVVVQAPASIMPPPTREQRAIWDAQYNAPSAVAARAANKAMLAARVAR